MTRKWPKLTPEGPKNAVFQNLTSDYENSDFSSEKNALCFSFQANLSKIEFFRKMEALKKRFAFFRVVDVI